MVEPNSGGVVNGKSNASTLLIKRISCDLGASVAYISVYPFIYLSIQAGSKLIVLSLTFDIIDEYL
jgi:hypothetical protein